MSNKQKSRPETGKLEQASTPAPALSNELELPETKVEKAEHPAVALSGEQERPETRVELAEKPELVAATGESLKADKPKAVKQLDLGDVKIPVVAVTNPHYGLSGPTVSVTVSVLNEDGSREGLQLNDIPERLLK